MGSLWSKKEEQESSEVRAERKRQKGQAVSKALFSCNPYVLKRVRWVESTKSIKIIRDTAYLLHSDKYLVIIAIIYCI